MIKLVFIVSNEKEKSIGETEGKKKEREEKKKREKIKRYHQSWVQH